ncbi:MAG: porin [Pseudorhodoplanes sp.]|nr:porin [Pseudorhodoplanes sp.]
MRSEHGDGSGALRIAAAVAVMLCAGMAAAQSTPKPASASDICAKDDDDEEGKAEKPAPLWKRFTFEGACVELSGSLGATYQKQKASAGAVSVLTTRKGSVSGASEVKTATADFQIDTRRKTAIGELKTAFAVKYEKASSDPGNGSATLTEGLLTWAGIKAGYTDSQMNFWSGDFQFSASAPQRTVGLAGYQFKLNDDWSLTLAYETGLPTTQAASVKFVTAYPDDPVASARLSYGADDVSFQLAGLVHELRIDGTHPLLAFLGRAAEHSELGWAATAGLTAPAKLGGKGSEFSLQATYAVNASPYLGTAADLSSLASTVPVAVATEGWSVVGSHHFVWSEQWETNVMASHLALDVTLPRARPSVRTRRYAANVIWKPVEDFKLGVELGYVEAELETGGPLGLVKGISGRALAGYLYATVTF